MVDNRVHKLQSEQLAHLLLPEDSIAWMECLGQTDLPPADLATALSRPSVAMGPIRIKPAQGPPLEQATVRPLGLRSRGFLS